MEKNSKSEKINFFYAPNFMDYLFDGGTDMPGLFSKFQLDSSLKKIHFVSVDYSDDLAKRAAISPDEVKYEIEDSLDLSSSGNDIVGFIDKHRLYNNLGVLLLGVAADKDPYNLMLKLEDIFTRLNVGNKILAAKEWPRTKKMVNIIIEEFKKLGNTDKLTMVKELGEYNIIPKEEMTKAFLGFNYVDKISAIGDWPKEWVLDNVRVIEEEIDKMPPYEADWALYELITSTPRTAVDKEFVVKTLLRIIKHDNKKKETRKNKKKGR